jgi:hypothetical protein
MTTSIPEAKMDLPKKKTRPKTKAKKKIKPKKSLWERLFGD